MPAPPGTTPASSSMLRPLIDFLRMYPPFSQMTLAQLEFLAKRLQPSYYARGERISPRAEVCIVKSGRIRVSERGQPVHEIATGGILTVSQPGTHEGGRRLEAVEDCFCLELDRDGADALTKMSPVFHAFRAISAGKDRKGKPAPGQADQQ